MNSKEKTFSSAYVQQATVASLTVRSGWKFFAEDDPTQYVLIQLAEPVR